MIISFMAPMSWALVNIIDVYFVDGVYKDELDGTIISGLFQILPWFFLVFLLNVDFGRIIDRGPAGNIFGINSILWISFVGGVLYTSAFYFYFKALFNHNDVSLLQILWNLTVIAVPVLSFILLKESLPIYKYIGMGVTFAGATMLSFNPEIRKKLSRRYIFIMLGAVLFLSVSMILQERAFSLLDELFGNDGFWFGFLFFGIGAFITGVLFSIYSNRNPLPLIRKYYKIFIIGEGIYFLGNLFSQRAIDLAPSVSYVAVIETFVPVFVLAFSLIIIFIFYHLFKVKSGVIKRIYSEQASGIWIKIFATVVMAVGVYIIS
jgi:drug/metabolite transporter (DMT)-like permease